MVCPVSILTRPCDRVQRLPEPTSPVCLWERFNPHPALRPGATTHLRCPQPDQLGGQRFQSSPGLATGCNGRNGLTSRFRRTTKHVCFNPHPALRPGATSARRITDVAVVADKGCFNPHPALRPGATCSSTPLRIILAQRDSPFQSSPGLATGCNYCRYGDSQFVSKFRTRFQSSPGLATGCNLRR